MGGSIKSLVSDRALALIQLAVQGLGVQSLPDLFHGMGCLSRTIGARLGGQARSYQETITTNNQGNNGSSPEGKTDFCFPEPTAISSP